MSRRRIASILAMVLTLPGLLFCISIWASLRYRGAVHALHDELAGIDSGSLEITEEYIDHCWAGLAPASVRRLRAADADGGFATIVGLYNTALADRGFSDGGGARRSHRWTRERDDDLDTDIVVMGQLADGVTVEVVADVFDADSVFCTPF